MGAIYTKMQKCLLISLLAQFSAGQFCSGQTTQPSHDNLPLVREIGHATDSELGELLRHECTDGALYAAWERMSRGLVNDRQLAIERLLGFVEGRLRVNIPSAWESRIANMEIMDDRSVRWGLISSVGSFSIQNHFRISMTPGFDFQSYDGIWHLTSDYLNVPLSMFDESAKQIQVAGSVVSCERMALAADGDDGLIIGLSFDAPDTYGYTPLIVPL